MMTLEEVWESLKQDPEIKATIEEVEKSYKLFKKIENLIVADLESKLAQSERFMQVNGFKNWKEAQNALNGKFECIFDEKHELWKKLVAENTQLKQELKEKEKHIIGQNALLNKSKENNNQLKQQLAECEQEKLLNSYGMDKNADIAEDYKRKLAESKEQLIDMNEKSNKIKKESYYLKQQLAETDKLMQEYLSKCLSLEQQLTEKEKEIEELKKGVYKVTLGTTPSNQIDVTENFYVIPNQTAIAELEKVINLFEPYENSEKDTILCANNGISFLEYINQRIKELKGEK
jgi:chromosome segregation ATPase